MVHNIFIVDGEPAQRGMLESSLKNRLGYRTLSVNCADSAINHFTHSNSQRMDVILYDCSSIRIIEMIAALKTLCAYAPIVVLVKYGDYETAAAALMAGAQDFLTKPVAIERMSTTFRNLILLRDARNEVERLRRERAMNAESSQLTQANTQAQNPAHALALVTDDGNIRRMQEIEAEAIRFALQYYHGRMTEVARRLGIGRSTLYRKLSEFEVRQREEAA